jgi:hypothetical protein
MEDTMYLASLRSHLIAGLVVTGLLAGSGGSVVGQTDAARWREDLKVFADELPRLHRNLFDHMTREEFDAAVGRLDERIPSMEVADITAELTRIVGMVGDGHTRLVELSGPVMLGWRRYPVRFALFADGLFVEAASPDHATLVGRRVKQIGAMDADKAVAAVTPFVPRDNSMNARQRVPGYLAFAEILRAAGVTADRSTISLVVDGPGGEITTRLDAVSASAPVQWMTMRDEAKGPTPRWAPRPGNPYWFEYLPETRILYVQFNAVADKPDEPLEAFWDRVFRTVADQPVERFVLDLRQNGGGDNTLNRSLIHHLIRSDKINKRGSLFALIGRRTFSAATALAVDLEKHTNVLFVGEPTGGHPNHDTDAGRLVLPNSGLRISYSPFFWDYSFPGDTRVWIAPHLAVDLSSDDYVNGRDPAFEAIVHYVPEKTPADLLTDTYLSSGLDAALGALQAWRDNPRHRYVDLEWDIHLFGRRLMFRKHMADAIRVFELNVRAYPSSFRGFEDLGVAFATAGDVARAAASFRRSLELNPSNVDAADALEAIQRKTGASR